MAESGWLVDSETLKKAAVRRSFAETGLSVVRTEPGQDGKEAGSHFHRPHTREPR